MNPLLDQLQPYPFARLREAMQGVNPPEGVTPVHLHIGEPKHPTPEVITNALTAQPNNSYPQMNAKKGHISMCPFLVD